MSDQQNDDRILIEEVPLVVEVNYHDHEHTPCNEDLVLAPGHKPFILFEMKQRDGAVHLDVTASLIDGEDELIETLEVFFETMLEERRLRGLIALSPEDIEDLVDGRDV